MKYLLLISSLFFSLVMVSQNIEGLAKEKPITISGAVSSSIGYYNTSNISNTMQPLQYSIAAAPILSIYNSVQIPFNFVVTQGSSELSNPFYQIGINPYYKGWKGYFGWTNMSWSDYVLNGKTFLGAGSELQLGILRLGAMYGRFNPAIPRDTTKLYSETSQYTRSGYAVKLGIGREKNYFDLMLLRGHDHVNSIPSDELNSAPRANLVIGGKSFQTFNKGKITWTLDAAVEAHTKDLRGANYEYDTTNTLLKTLNDFIPLKYSTSYSWAVKNILTYRERYFNLGVEFYRIQPEYTTFGVDYMMNDQQKITLKEGFRTKDVKHIFNFIQSYQTDNLNNRKAISTGRWSTTNMWNFNASPSFGLSTSYSLFVIQQSQGNKFLSDSLRLFQFNHNAMLNPRWNIMKENGSHNISLMLMYQGMQDENEKSKYRISGKTFNINATHNYFVNASQWNFSSGINWLLTSNNAIDFMSLGPSIGVSKPFNQNKINTGYNFSYLHNIQNGSYFGNTITNGLNASFAIDKHHNLQYNFNFMISSQLIGSSINELRTDLRYTYSF